MHKSHYRQTHFTTGAICLDVSTVEAVSLVVSYNLVNLQITQQLVLFYDITSW